MMGEHQTRGPAQMSGHALGDPPHLGAASFPSRRLRHMASTLRTSTSVSSPVKSEKAVLASPT